MELQIPPETEKPQTAGGPATEDPPSLKKIKSKARQYGFTEVATYRNMHPLIMGVPWEKVDGRYHLIEGILYTGTDLISNLEKNGPIFYDGFIEIGGPHEGGHEFVPKNRQNEKVPYSVAEIMDRQERLGMDVRERKAIGQQESQANVYAVVEDGRHKNMDEVKHDVAGFVWHTSCYSATYTASSFWKCVLSIGFLRKRTLSSLANSYVNDYFPWLKKEARNEIVRMALDIDREYCASTLDEAKK